MVLLREWRTYRWVRVTLTQTDSGGNLAAVLVMEAACLFRNFKPVFQLLIVPVIDNNATPGNGWVNIHAPWLTPARMMFYRGIFMPRQTLSQEDWQTSPNLAPKKLLARCPPTWVAIAEHDLLATEGLLYAQQLRQAGVQVDMKAYLGSTHCILALNGVLPKGRELMSDAAYVLNRAFRPRHFTALPSPEGSI